jgi:hypothetical protein
MRRFRRSGEFSGTTAVLAVDKSSGLLGVIACMGRFGVKDEFACGPAFQTFCCIATWYEKTAKAISQCYALQQQGFG